MVSMKKININLASTRSLLVFESAARLGSFTRAAEELRIGQPAVSHGIRHLENLLGTRLFVRRHRGVELTVSGERLAEKVQRGLQEIIEGLEAVSDRRGTQTVVTLTVSTSLAGYWLMPRLSQFKRQWPDIEIRCITRDSDHDLARESFDLCIPLGTGPWPGFDSMVFIEEELLAVCSPAYLQRLGGQGLQNLVQADLLHLEERYRKRYGWTDWFKHFGLKHAAINRGPVSNDYSIVIQGALEDQGVALGWHHIVAPLLQQGSLVKAACETIRTANPFYIISPIDQDSNEAVTALRDWLIREAALTLN